MAIAVQLLQSKLLGKNNTTRIDLTANKEKQEDVIQEAPVPNWLRGNYFPGKLFGFVLIIPSE
jgi:hypothetical protein